MRRTSARLLVPLLALALVAAACGSGGDKRPGDTIKEIRDLAAKDVDPPGRVDPKNLALPGFALVTNSPTWEKLVDAANGRGAVILFVQPGSPADNKGIARGDMLTEVDGERVANQEHALALLYSNKGEKRNLKITGRNGKERELSVRSEIPKDRPKRFLDEMIKGNPNDPVLRYLRAGAIGTTIQSSIDDLKVALDVEPEFVEALNKRAFFLFSARLGTKDKKRQQELITQALAAWTNALDIDPRNAEALTQQANAETALGKASAAKADALKAIRVDPTYPAANNALAKANLSLKKPQDAAGPARAALELNPYTNLTYYRTLAEVFKDLKRKTDCSATLNAIVPWLEGTKVKPLKTEAEQIQKEARENCG
jgi:tetratricopeptide (TPR) repeat protein